MKVGADDEIDEKDADVSSVNFVSKFFFFFFFFFLMMMKISRYLGFPDGSFKLFLAKGRMSLKDIILILGVKRMKKTLFSKKYVDFMLC